MKTFQNPRFANKRGFTFSVSGQTQQENPKEEIVPKYYTCNYRKCGRTDVVAPSDTDPAACYCSQRCLDLYNAEVQRVLAEAQKFMEKNKGLYYSIESNNQLLIDTVLAWGKEVTAANLEQAMLTLIAEKKLLLPLTPAQIAALDGDSYERRLKLDPEMSALSESELAKVTSKRVAEPAVFSATQDNRRLRAEMIDKAYQQSLAAQTARRRG
jgi:hypothetical protein